MNKAYLYRGPKAKYDSASKHVDAIYFATDTGELLMNGNLYGGGIKDITYDKDTKTLTVIKNTGTETEYDLSELIAFTTSLPDTLATPTKIGGLSQGTTVETLKTKTLSQIFEDILFEELQPSVQNPSCSVSPNGSWAANGIYEVGAAAPQSDNFTKSFNRGKCTVVGQADLWRAGEQTSDELTYGGSTTLPTEITLGAMSYQYKVNYAQGDELKTSKGNKASLIPNPLTSGSVTSTTTIYGTYPYFCNGASASASAQDTSLPSTVTPDTKLPLVRWTEVLIGAKFASEATTGTRLEFYFPQTKTVGKVEFFNTVSGKWEVFASNNYAVSDAGNKTIQENNVAYNKLTTTGGLSGALQLRFTMNNASTFSELSTLNEAPTYEGESITPDVVGALAMNSTSVPFTTFNNDVVTLSAATGNRAEGVAAFAVNFEPGGQVPLDARSLVPSKADLINPDTYSANNYYKDMLVVVGDTGEGEPGLFLLVDTSKITEADYSGWKQIDATASEVIEIINDLVTGGVAKALSAEQGKVLKGLVDTLTTRVDGLGSVYDPKGSVDDLTALKAIATVSKGHVYNVSSAVDLNGKHYPAETNFVYIGETEDQASVETNWDSLGGTVDLSAYALKSELTPFLTQEDLADYALKSELTSLATKAELADYVKTTDAESTYAKKSDLTDYVTTTTFTSTLSSYTTNTQLTDALADYPTNTELTETLNDYVTTDSLNSTLGNYVSDTELTETLDDYPTNTELTTTLGSYVTNDNLTTTLGSYVTTTNLTSTLNSYATKDELNNLLVWNEEVAD